MNLSWTAATDNVGVTGYRIYRDGFMVGTVGTATATPTRRPSPARTYDYQVRAVDAAGHESGPSETATVTTPAAPRTFAAEADARVEQANAGTNYGTSGTLRTDGASDPDIESYLRFRVTDLAGPVQSAKLRVRTATDTADGPAAYATDWTGRGDRAHLEQPSRAHQRSHRRQGPPRELDLGRVRRHAARHRQRRVQLRAGHELQRRHRLPLAQRQRRDAQARAGADATDSPDSFA